MKQTVITTAGVVTGMAIASAVGIVLAGKGKIKPRKLARKTANAAQAVGDAMYSVAEKMK